MTGGTGCTGEWHREFDESEEYQKGIVRMNAEVHVQIEE